jgi:uncharacterized protein (DUF885 family)
MRAVVALAVVAACGGPRPPAPTRDRAAAAAEVTAIADEIVRAWIANFPESAAMTGIDGAPDDGLEDNSLAALQAWHAQEDGWDRRLVAIDWEALWGREEWITFGFVRAFIDGSRATRICRYELWPVNQLSGWQARLPRLADVQRVGTAELRAKALARWRLIPHYIDNDTANARAGLTKGYSSPRANVDLVITQLDALLALAPEASPFWSPAARDPALAAEWRALITEQIQPAIRRQRDYLRDHYRAAARESFAVSANPDGVACYRASFQAYTTIDRDPRETFALGTRVVAENLRQAQALAGASLGVTDLPAIVARLKTDAGNRLDSREQTLESVRAAVARAREAMGRAFEVLPRAEVVVEPYPAFLEASASDSYEAPALDGSRPGRYQINLGSFADATRSDKEVTAFHETYPGHHLQIAIARENPHRHRIATLVGNGAFIEGWARYAEALAEELDLYSSDHARIQRRLWPARGMVADPGLHLFGWTPEQTAAYLREAGRFADSEIGPLVNRMANWPAQMTSYDTGALEIFRLRRKAEAALGARFDLRAFHRALLEHGAVTLPMLDRIIERWIVEQQRRVRSNAGP